MKRNLLFILFAIFHLLQGHAERPDTLSKNFHFVYIDHESTTPIGQVCQRIIKLKNDALEMGDALIIYLANDEEPYFSFTNLGDSISSPIGTGSSNFNNIIDELQYSTYHEVNALSDVQHIKELISSEGLFPIYEIDEGNSDIHLLFKSVVIDFYVSKRFWALRHNENVIAQLFVSLNISDLLQKYPKQQFAFNVFKSKEEQIIYPEGKPFGLHNLENINNKLSILEY